MSNKVASYGMLMSLALILSYVEALIPTPLGIFGIKLGLANLAIFIALYYVGSFGALKISIARIFLVSFLFSNMFSMIYSLAGGLLSFIIMAAAKKYKWFSKIGISVLGGVFHNVGQITVAAFVVNTAVVFYYLPFLLIAGTVTGALIGLLGGYLLERLPKTSGF